MGFSRIVSSLLGLVDSIEIGFKTSSILLTNLIANAGNSDHDRALCVLSTHPS